MVLPNFYPFIRLSNEVTISGDKEVSVVASWQIVKSWTRKYKRQTSVPKIYKVYLEGFGRHAGYETTARLQEACRCATGGWSVRRRGAEAVRMQVSAESARTAALMAAWYATSAASNVGGQAGAGGVPVPADGGRGAAGGRGGAGRRGAAGAGRGRGRPAAAKLLLRALAAAAGAGQGPVGGLLAGVAVARARFLRAHRRQRRCGRACWRGWRWASARRAGVGAGAGAAGGRRGAGVGHGAALRRGPGWARRWRRRRCWPRSTWPPSARCGAGCTPLRLLHWLTVAALAVAVPPWLALDGVPAPRSARTALLLAADGALAWLQAVLAFGVLSRVSPLTYAVCGAAKRVAVIAASLLVLRNPASPANVLGMALAAAGGVRVPARPPRAPAAAAAPRAAAVTLLLI
ncbi:hypothetical protein ACJJTC_017632 [Scirpophaga incertulas]